MSDFLKEALRRVRARYSAEEFGKKGIDELREEVNVEIARLKRERDRPPGFYEDQG